MTEERAQGQWDQAKGTVKEEVGRVTGDRSTETSGKLDQVKGKAEDALGKVKQEIDRNGDR